VFIAGAVVVGLAVRFQVGDSMFNIKTLSDAIKGEGLPADLTLDRFKNISFGILVGAGGVGVLTGIFGFFFTCCKSKCYAVMYGIFLSVTWVVIIILGAILTAVSYVPAE
jgi:hypothetical protein